MRRTPAFWRAPTLPFSAAALFFLCSANPPPALPYDQAVLVSDLPAVAVAAPVQPMAAPQAPQAPLLYADLAPLGAGPAEVIRWDQLTEPLTLQQEGPRTSAGTARGGITGAVRVVVSIPQQKAFVFRGASLLWTTPVSTGKPGHSTPTGTFRILQKKVKHRSNIYANAPMPYMQRLTRSGIALHAGHLPGYRASHGCIRLPWSNAKKLFGITSHGTPVTVTNQRVNATA